jgi:lipoprotein NlpI
VSLAGSNAISDAFDRCRHIQKANGSIFGQPLQRCFGAGNPTADQTIEGCATVIAAGLWTGKDAAIPLQQRVNAYEKKGDYEHVIADTTETLQLYPDAAVIRATRGRAPFFQADFSAAAADLSRSVALKDDPYTTIWLFLARRRAGPEGESELASGAGKLKSTDWPYPVVDFYLGRRSADEMQAAATKPEEKCEAAFYLAEWHLLKANAAEAKPLLQTAADTCPEGFVEHSGAQAELKRLAQ